MGSSGANEAILSRIGRAWGQLQKEGLKEKIDRVLVELWHVQAPPRVLVAGPALLSRYTLELREEVADEHAPNWVDEIRLVAEMSGGKHGFELSFFFEDRPQSRVRIPFEGGPGPYAPAAGAPAAAAPTALPAGPAYPTAGELGMSQLAMTVSSMTQMLMRHYEKTQETVNKSLQQIFAYNEGQFARLTSRITELEDGRTKLILIQEDMLTTKAEREIGMRQAEAKDKRAGQMFDKGFTMLSAFLTHAANQNKGTARGVMRNVGWKNFVESLSKDQFAKMLSQLDPEQQLALLQIIEGVQDELGENEPPANDPPKGPAA